MRFCTALFKFKINLQELVRLINVGAVAERPTAALRVAGSIPHVKNICMAYRCLCMYDTGIIQSVHDSKVIWNI